MATFDINSARLEPERASGDPSVAPAPASAEAVERATAPSAPDPVTAILLSRTFALSTALRSLLLYLWQHREETVSEYAVAVEALGRSANFDPKLDATVRVQVSRLRQRLEKYYEQEGQHCAERLLIPLGSHQIRVETLPPCSSPPPDQPAAPPDHWATRRWTVVLGSLCIALLLICTALALALYHSQNAPTRPIQETSRFWKAFFSNGRPTRIILPSPVFFGYRGGYMLRDVRINDFLDADSSQAVRDVSKLLGPPNLADNYTVTSDTFAAVQLARYLERCGLDTSLHSSADAPLDALDNENMVAIGTRGTLNAIKLYLDRMTMRSLPGDNDVEINDARPGEPKRVNLQHESNNQERAIWPGVIGFLPGRTGRTRLLVLTSRHTSALVSLLTSANGQDQLERIWKSHGSPEYFEVVVSAEMNGENLVRFWPVALHPIAAQH